MPSILADLPEHAQLVAKLRAAADVPERELAALLDLKVQVREFARGEDVVRQNDRPSHSSLLLSGVACRYKMLPDGSRQIMSFHIAGDVPDLQSVHLQTMDHSIGALRPSRTAAIPHEDLRRVIYGNPTICHVLWRDTLIDAAIHREWMMGIGRLPSQARIAHLFCELLVKHEAAGLAHARSFPLPLTQSELADALGLTSVHVNRVLQDLRAQGLIQLERGGEATILDWESLKELGAFDPTYMHMRPGQVA